MKRLFCLLLAAGLYPCSYAVAQVFPTDVGPASVIGIELRGDTMIYRSVKWSDEVVDQAGRHYRLLPVKALPEQRHALSLEIGAYPACGNRSIIPETVDYEIAFPRFPGVFPGEQRYYAGPLRMSGAIGAAYAYRVRRWLEVGVTFSYAGFWRDLHRTSDRRVAMRQREHYLTLMPLLRFSWYNSRSVRLYSVFQLGWQWGHEKSYFYEYGNFNYVAAQVTPIGISVGRRVFGYAEVGIGMRGLLVAGVGYRFGKQTTEKR